MKQPNVFAWMAPLVAGVVCVSGSAQSQPGALGKSSTPFPSQYAKEIRWLDSLAKGIEEASSAKKPILLILAGQRPSGDC